MLAIALAAVFFILALSAGCGSLGGAADVDPDLLPSIAADGI